VKYMKTQFSIRKAVLGAWAFLGCCGWICSQPAASWAQDPRGNFTLGRVNGVFTVEDFKNVNGISHASGWLTASVTDTETNEVGTFTNFPVRMPVSGLLSANPVEVGLVSDPVILPQLSTNTCEILGIVVGAIDVTIPGLGLNVHVNEISLIVRSDRETTIGDLLCNILGDGLLGSTSLASSKSTTAGSTPTSAGTGLAPAAPTNSVLTVGQLQGLMGILLGTDLSATPGTAGLEPTSGATATATGSSAKSADPKLALLQGFLQRVITTIEPPKSAAPTSQTPSPTLKGAQPVKSAAP
jgi:hypothetical protein